MRKSIDGVKLISLAQTSRDGYLVDAVEHAARDPLGAWDECESDEERVSRLSSINHYDYHDIEVSCEVDDETSALAKSLGTDSGPRPAPATFPPLVEMPSLKLGLFLVLLTGSIVACVVPGPLNTYLAELAGEDSPHEFSTKFLKLASIPIGTTVFTWAHVWAALWATFYPLEFVGCLQIPGTNVGLGWRGIIPFKGEEMAVMACRMIKERLLSTDEVFRRLVPSEMAEAMRPGISVLMEQVVETVAEEEFPQLWSALPEAAKRLVIKGASAESPKVVERMLVEMRPRIDELLDLEHLVVEVLCNDLKLCVDVFIVCGHKELAFIRNAGAVMGGTLGIAQMVMYMYYDPWWLLPVVGCVAGAFTNWLALLLIFWPVEPHDFCCGRCRLHGRFLRRQKEVAKAYAEMVGSDVLTVRRIVTELLAGGKRDQVEAIVRKNVITIVQESFAPVKPLLSVMGAEAATAEKVDRVQERVASLVNASMFDLMLQAEPYMTRAFDLRNTLETRMAALPYNQFVDLMHPIFEKDEYKIVILGAIVGAIFGTLQVLFIVKQP